MQNTTFTQHPAALAAALAQIQLIDLLGEFIDRRRVGARYLDIERAAARFGYEFKREHGNVYGRLMLVPVVNRPVPRFRVITRSDHAATYGSKRGAA